MDTQLKKSFFKRFWWLFVIAGIGLIIFGVIATISFIHDRQLNNQGRNSDNGQKSTAEFAWPDPDAKTITAVPLDLSQIQGISKFRSCSGHDRAGYNFNKVLETDRSMKHYIYPAPEFQGTVDKIKMFAPFDGTVAMIQWVSPDGTQVRSDWLHKDGVKDYGKVQIAESGGRTNSGSDIDLFSTLDDNAVFGFRHVVFSRDFQIGDTVKAGEFIGYASVSEKENDFDIDYVGRMYKPEDGKNIEVLDSMFNHMTPVVLAEFAKYGLTPENTSFTKDERDAKPCGYDPVTKYGSKACEEYSADNNNQLSGRNNTCWIQLIN